MKGDFSNKRFLLVFLLLASAVVNTVHGRGRGTFVGFYSSTCPQVESIVKSTVQCHVKSDPTLAAALLRLHFHDCFVRGCDASILIKGAGTESTAPPNLSLRGYEVIDDAKAKLEAACPGVVSCADILALAARDSVVLSGGESWKVPTGRRDGRLSYASEPLNLPSPNDTVRQLLGKFEKKGLNIRDLVILAGGHTIGTANCSSFRARLYNPNGIDNSADPSFLATLRQLCPRHQSSNEKLVALDTGSQFKFDTSYFANLKRGRGLLKSDQVLWTDPYTRRIVQRYSAPRRFKNFFGKSMVKMGNIHVKTGTHGEIRKKCSVVN